jgi:hypothetical protein
MPSNVQLTVTIKYRWWWRFVRPLAIRYMTFAFKRGWMDWDDAYYFAVRWVQRAVSVKMPPK